MKRRGRVIGRRRYARNEPPEPTLGLTSMIDIFTNLLVFLLISFSADPQLLYGGEDMELPKTFAREPITRTVQVAVTADRVIIDGQEILAELPTYATTEDVLMIPPLFDMLQVKKAELIARERAERGEPAEPPPPPPAAEGEEAPAEKPWTGSAIIQADKNITFNVLKRVMYTADRAGFPTQHLALLAKTPQ